MVGSGTFDTCSDLFKSCCSTAAKYTYIYNYIYIYMYVIVVYTDIYWYPFVDIDSWFTHWRGQLPWRPTSWIWRTPIAGIWQKERCKKTGTVRKAPLNCQCLDISFEAIWEKHMCLVSTCVPVKYRAHPKWEKTFYKVLVTISLCLLYIYTLPLCLYKYLHNTCCAYTYLYTQRIHVWYIYHLP